MIKTKKLIFAMANYEKNINNFIEFVYLLNNIHLSIERIKSITEDKLMCLSDEEISIKRFSNSCNYIFNNINQVFKEEILDQAYYLLNNELPNKDITKNIIELYYQNYDNSTEYLSSLIHLFIIKNIEKRNIEFAFLVSNYIIQKREGAFLIPYEYSHSEYLRAIKNNNLSNLMRVFFDIKRFNKEKKSRQLSFEEVINRIKEKKKYLIETFKMQKLYLFGSYAKGKNTDKSDIDFVVIFNDELINIEKNEVKEKLIQYFESEFNSDVDILDFSYALENLGENEMENIVTLI